MLVVLSSTLTNVTFSSLQAIFEWLISVYLNDIDKPIFIY